jgi:hypothetical protein
MAFLILETATGLLFGGFLGAQISGQDHTAALWILGVSYGLLVIAKVSTQRLFPSAVIDQLEATHHLEVSKKEVARRDVISGFITHSISALNEQTCALSGDREESLCSRAVGAGLAAVIDPLITRPQYLFDCNESQFTIAAVVTYQAPQPRGWRQDIITFRDDLDMGDCCLMTSFLSIPSREPRSTYKRRFRDVSTIIRLLATPFNTATEL